ncbi:MAG: cadherin repeat domain-containing protein, partial [Planctomycetales bacterium]|nr:cadherin repeat domain-containing protein [Planctomycetales bacterium]
LAIEPGLLVSGANGSGGGSNTNVAPTISNQTFSVNADAAVSTLVGTVQANDADGDAITYAILAGNTNNAFSIDSSGRLRIANSAFGATGQYDLTVRASDTAANNASATVTVNVTPAAPTTTTQIGEVGRVSMRQQSKTHWQTVRLNRTYQNPVVILGPLSATNRTPAVVRVSNVTSNSFRWQIDEWDYLDGPHSLEAVSYMVVEAGTHTLSDGTKLIAGTTTATHASTNVALTGLTGTPVVLSTVTTVNGGAAVTTRLTNVNSNGFSVRVQEEEGGDGFHARESIAYVAIEQGSGFNSGKQFESGTTAATHANKQITFGSTFSAAPSVFANIQTTSGADTSSTRFYGLSGSSVYVYVAEEQSRDTEQYHATETIGYLAMATGTLTAQTTGGNQAGVRIGELERTSVDTHTFTVPSNRAIEIDSYFAAAAPRDQLDTHDFFGDDDDSDDRKNTLSDRSTDTDGDAKHITDTSAV